MKKLVTAFSLCAALMMTSCTQTDVAASDSDAHLATEAELSPCCSDALKGGKDECCGDLTKYEVCEESGKIFEKACEAAADA
jgi:hypothetical protein